MDGLETWFAGIDNDIMVWRCPKCDYCNHIYPDKGEYKRGSCQGMQFEYGPPDENGRVHLERSETKKCIESDFHYILNKGPAIVKTNILGYDDCRKSY